MKIQVTKGTGKGPTELAAFDQALVHAGIANFNLIYLSSVLPPDSEVVPTDKPLRHPGEWGDKLYIVIAQKRTVLRNQEVWAGIGWIQDEKTKKGLLVEHEGHSETEVRSDIEHSLAALAQNRKMKFGPINMVVNGIRCENEPVCALVVAAFESTAWNGRKLPTSNESTLQRLARKLSKNG